MRQLKCLNNIAEQDHRAVKRMTKPMLNFKSFRSAKSVLADIELMHMIRKGRRLLESCIELSFADQFYALAGQIGSYPKHAYQLATRQNLQKLDNGRYAYF